MIVLTLNCVFGYFFYMKYTIEFTNKAHKIFLSLPRVIRFALEDRLQRIADDPYRPDNNVKKMSGFKDCYRLRHGDYRVVYDIINGTLVLKVIAVSHRSEVYR